MNCLNLYALLKRFLQKTFFLLRPMNVQNFDQLFLRHRIWQFDVCPRGSTIHTISSCFSAIILDALTALTRLSFNKQIKNYSTKLFSAMILALWKKNYTKIWSVKFLQKKTFPAVKLSRWRSNSHKYYWHQNFCGFMNFFTCSVWCTNQNRQAFDSVSGNIPS